MKLNGTSINVSKLKEIASGGEGKIMELNNTHVLKVYHSPKKKEVEKHLQKLSCLSDKFVKPEDILYNDTGDKVHGYSMRYVNLNNYFLFNNLFNKGFCNNNKITRDFKIGVLGKLKECVEEAHGKEIILGDENPYNIFVAHSGEVLMIDVDSYATPEQPHSGVLIEEIRDWSTTQINKETDIWAYDILAFWSLCHLHPFKYIAKGDNSTLEQRVRARRSVLSMIPDLKLPALYEPPTATERPQYEEIFNKGRRYMIDLGGTVSPVNIVIPQAVYTNALQVQEVLFDITKVYATSNYISAQYSNGDWAHVETNTLRVTRTIKLYGNTDEFYPTDNGLHALIRGSILYSHDGRSTDFVMPEFYYNAGSLSVLSYLENIQTNYNLNNQMVGIDNTKVEVFAKSVLYRGAPIQNFGAKKYLNIPIRNSYTLVEVPFGTKDAYYCNGFFGVEYVSSRGNKIEYLVSNKKHDIHLDYLPYFAVKGDILFLPEDGHIDVYKEGTCISKLDAPTSRTSKLYSTNSGILCLENNILYLLNTR